MGNTHVFLSHKDVHKHSLLENDHSNPREHSIRSISQTDEQYGEPKKQKNVEKSEDWKKKATFVRHFSLRKFRDKSHDQKGKSLRNSQTDTFYKHHRLSNGTHYEEEAGLDDKHVVFQTVKEEEKQRGPSVSLESLPFEEETHIKSFSNKNVSNKSSPSHQVATQPATKSEMKPPQLGNERDNVTGYVSTDKQVSLRNGPRFSHSSYGPDAYSDDDVFPDLENKCPSADRRPMQFVGSMAQRGFHRMRKSFRSLRLHGPNGVGRKKPFERDSNNIHDSMSRETHHVGEDRVSATHNDATLVDDISIHNSSVSHTMVSVGAKRGSTKTPFSSRVRASFHRRRRRTRSSTADDAAMLE